MDSSTRKTRCKPECPFPKEFQGRRCKAVSSSSSSSSSSPVSETPCSSDSSKRKKTPKIALPILTTLVRSLSIDGTPGTLTTVPLKDFANPTVPFPGLIFATSDSKGNLVFLLVRKELLPKKDVHLETLASEIHYNGKVLKNAPVSLYQFTNITL